MINAGGMAVVIVEEVPPAHRTRRFGRGIAVLLGIVLLAAGLLVLPVPVASAIGVVGELVSGEQTDNRTSAILVTAGAIVACLGLCWLGLRLVRGRRRMGLYLRKFGFAGTTETVSHAVSRAVGRSLRLVTLDDSMVAPIGAGRGRRWSVVVVTLLGSAGVAAVLYFFFGGTFQHLLSPVTDGAPESISDSVGRALGALVLAVLLLLAGIVAAIVGLFGGAASLAARRAERGATQTFTSEAEVDRAAGRLSRASRRIFAARLVVVAVPTPFWQRAVYGLAAVAEVVVIDVSFPTENLVWEVRNIKPLFQGRWVLVGARDRVGPLARPDVFASQTPAGTLSRMLDREQILAYGPTTADRRRFARSLRRRLDDVRRTGQR